MTCSYPNLTDWGGRRPAEAEDSSVQLAEELAWTTFLSLAAGRVTVCPVTVRPVPAEAGWHLTWLTAPVGTWAGSGNELLRMPPDAVLYSSALGYGPHPHQRIPLEAPVGQIVEVRIGGTVLDPLAYRVDSGVLVRTDGAEWPRRQDLISASGPDVFEVVYYRGYRAGLLVQRAVAALAAEFYLSFSGDRKCRLPERVTAITRQGVSFQMPATVFEDGRTGIREVDLVLRRYNPNGLSQPPVIASPDTLRRTPRVIGY